MLTTNTTRVKTTEDDGKRRVITTTNMKPAKVRFMQTDFPGVQKRETNKVDPSVKFNTINLGDLMRTSLGDAIAVKSASGAKQDSIPVKLSASAPAIKTPQPKHTKKVAPKKRKAK